MLAKQTPSKRKPLQAQGPEPLGEQGEEVVVALKNTSSRTTQSPLDAKRSRTIKKPSSQQPPPKQGSLSPGPKDEGELFQYMRMFNETLVDLHGQQFVKDAYLKENWLIDTLFTGADSAAAAGLAVEAGSRAMGDKGMQVSIGFAADRDRGCQRLLQGLFPSRCLYGEVETMVENAKTTFPTSASKKVHVA